MYKMADKMETSRLILRPWEEKDAFELYKYAKDERIGPAAGWPVHKSPEDSREIIRTVLSEAGTYAIIMKDTGKVIGSIGLMVGGKSHIENLPETEAEIGYWIGVPYWGKGLIPEAVAEIIRYAFEECLLKKLWCGYFEGNEKSRKVQKKCGFRYHHTNSDKEWPLMGDVRTEHVSVIFREEWKRKRNNGEED